MAIQNIECQIAKSQIGRYLSGDAFSPQALKQLEEHVSECDDCKASLNQRKAALQAMLTNTTSAVIEVQERDENLPKTVAEALRAKMGSKPRPPQQPMPVETPKVQAGHFWKPFGYSLALAGVLIGMSMYSKNLTKPFGNFVEPTTVNATTTPTTTEVKPVIAAAIPAPVTTTAATATPTATTPTPFLPPTATVPPKTVTPAPTGRDSVSDNQKTAPTSGTATAKPQATTVAHKTPITPAPVFTLPNKPTEKPATPKKADIAMKTATKSARARRAKATKARQNHSSAIRVYNADGTLIPSK